MFCYGFCYLEKETYSENVYGVGSLTVGPTTYSSVRLHIYVPSHVWLKYRYLWRLTTNSPHLIHLTSNYGNYYNQCEKREKDGDLTQSYDRPPYTNGKFENQRTTHKRHQKLRLHNDCGLTKDGQLE